MVIRTVSTRLETIIEIGWIIKYRNQIQFIYFLPIRSDKLELSSIRIPPNFKNVVYQTVITYGSENDYNQLFDIALKTVDNAEKLRMLRGLAASKDYALLKL